MAPTEYKLVYGGSRYGVIPPNFIFNLQNGYTVFAGRNDSGKSILLQFIFRNLIRVIQVQIDSLGIIQSDRHYAKPTTTPPTTLQQYNTDLANRIEGGPREFSSPSVGHQEALYSLFLHKTDFIRQVNQINKYLIRLGFDELVLRQNQEATVNDILITVHGSGLRCILPIVAALSSHQINIILIDEPELSLEARSQKVLKELFLEAVAQGKTVVVATQSHIFLDKQDHARNYIVENRSGALSVQQVASKEDLLNITYNLLGNSLEDLFFPSNFLIVEGASDQAICEKAAQLKDISPGKVKILSAKGIDNVQDTYKAIRNALIPLIADQSPYAKKVVVLVDRPTDSGLSAVEEIKKALGDRCFILDALSIEEYIPEAVYSRAERRKSEMLAEINRLKADSRHSGDALKDLEKFKKELSLALAGALQVEDLDTIPIIRDALILASKMVSS